MKNTIIKRTLSLLLALVCALGVLPLSAFAATGLSSAPDSITQKSSDYMYIGVPCATALPAKPSTARAYPMSLMSR